MYYSSAYKEATEAHAAGEYARAVEILRGMDLTLLPARYQDLEEIFMDSAYQAAEELYAAKKPYEALAYYRLIPDYRDVSSRKLTRTCYTIIGSWELDGKVKMVFRDDGTCLIDGEEHYYFASQYQIYLGESAEQAEMEYTYNIYRSTEKVLNLRHEKGRDKGKVDKMTRAAEAAGDAAE